MARRVAVVTQDQSHEYDFTVEEMVRLGRVPYKRSFGRQDQRDDEVVASALRQADLEELTDRPFTTLSGGEQQRALIARAVAQQAAVLLLDEPTNHLDVRAQLHTMRLIRSLGVTVLAVLHDLNLALAACDRVFVLSNGEIAASGPPDQVLTADLIRRVYGIDADVYPPGTGEVRVDVISAGVRETARPGLSSRRTP